ncbi:peptidoglycan DD-metalloendopeptidase family protein [Paraglaciecola sp. MB-3u-78]|uniref:peptidoglycan DD-metalloendopeptidase family protein n=1 Tax=Paraglaciecola sp. MB-3u-78 TaxID=2058332 RepID=UPI000C328F6B|nr:peptidoglycan DD-metalloendopeptidase family protein [Paraglaciecola sp. MB-3u-78]PKG99876.1 peptidase M23 [Paraglaciecola sp. MB-3u-78]
MIKKTFKNMPKPHRWVMSAVAGCMLILFLLPSEPVSAYKNSASILEVGKRYALEVNFNNLPVENISGLEEINEAKSVVVKKGDNLAMIFKRSGLSPQQTYRVSKAGKLAKKLLKIMPGDVLELQIDPQSQLISLQYPFSSTDTLVVTKSEDNTFTSKIETIEVDARLNYTQGDVTSSFWNAGLKANLTDNQIMQVAGIFGWDIDFALGLRAGDSFYVMFEEHYINGEFIENGDIVAAQFVNHGEAFTAIRYDDGNFYTPEGNSMRKSFLRAPVNFRYISSSFKKNRIHPVTKRLKAHRGVDYAADRGTPVMAAGDGKVIKAAYDKYNGHHVFIQHGEKYVTKYLHFTKRTVKRGQTVKQGQVIGTVGSSGRVTGPHLHYEFLVNGVHRNPRTVNLPKAEPIANKEKVKFTDIAAIRLQQLNNNKRVMLAMN